MTQRIGRKKYGKQLDHALVRAVVLLSIFAEFSGQASAIDVSTGVNTGWNYNTSQWGTGVASIVTPSDADWWFGNSQSPPWPANTSASSWIAANPNSTSGNNGTYSLSLDLTGYDLSTVSLSGSWAIDDQGTLSLNGQTLSSLPNWNWQSLNSFSAPSSDFVSGINTLTMVGGPTDNYLEGVRLQGDLTGTMVPEPSTWSLLALGVGTLFGGLRLSRRSS